VKIFEHFPQTAICRVCGTAADKPCTLIGIEGTQEGLTIECVPVHIDCIDLYCQPNTSRLSIFARRKNRITGLV